MSPFERKQIALMLAGMQNTPNASSADLLRSAQPVPNSAASPGNPNAAKSAMDFWLRYMMGVPFSGPLVALTGLNKLRGLLG